MKLLRCLVIVCLAAVLAPSCKIYKKINYLQDMQIDTTVVLPPERCIVIQPKDRITIHFVSRYKELVEPLNQASESSVTGGGGGGVGGGSQYGIVVNDDGNIEMPLLGVIHVDGLTRVQLEKKLQKMVIQKEIVNDVVVKVEFVNFKYYTLGELSPGTHQVPQDRINILQAISDCGDLTLDGVRDRIFVIRTQNGQRTTYQLDVRSTEIFNSPAFWLCQDDIIYVEPTHRKAGASTTNENTVRSIGFWFGIIGLPASIITMVASLIAAFRPR